MKNSNYSIIKNRCFSDKDLKRFIMQELISNSWETKKIIYLINSKKQFTEVIFNIFVQKDLIDILDLQYFLKKIKFKEKMIKIINFYLKIQ